MRDIRSDIVGSRTGKCSRIRYGMVEEIWSDMVGYDRVWKGDTVA